MKSTDHEAMAKILMAMVDAHIKALFIEGAGPRDISMFVSGMLRVINLCASEEACKIMRKCYAETPNDAERDVLLHGLSKSHKEGWKRPVVFALGKGGDKK